MHQVAPEISHRSTHPSKPKSSSGGLIPPRGVKKLFAEKGCFSRKCYFKETLNGKPKKCMPEESSIYACNENELEPASAASGGGASLFNWFLDHHHDINREHPSLTGPEFSNDIAGDGPKPKHQSLPTATESELSPDKEDDGMSAEFSPCNEHELELLPATGKGGVSMFKFSDDWSLYQRYTTCYKKNEGSDESKESGVPPPSGFEVESHEDFLNCERICRSNFASHDELAALCNKTIEDGAELLRHWALTDEQSRIVRLLCKILTHARVIPRLVKIGLASFNEGKVANSVGKASLGPSVGVECIRQLRVCY